jgi:hypothetical protein
MSGGWFRGPALRNHQACVSRRPWARLAQNLNIIYEQHQKPHASMSGESRTKRNVTQKCYLADFSLSLTELLSFSATAE